MQQIIDEQEGAEMILVHVSEPVMEALKESGFDEILFIEEDWWNVTENKQMETR